MEGLPALFAFGGASNRRFELALRTGAWNTAKLSVSDFTDGEH